MKNYQEIIKSVAPLLMIVLLFAFTAKFTLSKVSTQSTQIEKLTKEKVTLSAKVKLLSEISDTVSEGASAASIALPDTNYALAAISQLRFKALENGLTLGSLKAGNEVKDTSGLMRSDITFQVNGPKLQIVSFINSIPTIAPILITEKVKMTEVNEVTRADITVKSFWAELPKALPSLTQQLSDLTEKELVILDEVSALTPPSFAVNSPSVTGDRVDPFNQ